MISSGRLPVTTLFSSGSKLAEIRDLLLVKKDVRVLQHRFERGRIGHEVGRQITLVELHAFGVFERRVGALCLHRR